MTGHWMCDICLLRVARLYKNPGDGNVHEARAAAASGQRWMMPPTCLTGLISL